MLFLQSVKETELPYLLSASRLSSVVWLPSPKSKWVEMESPMRYSESWYKSLMYFPIEDDFDATKRINELWRTGVMIVSQSAI